MSTLEIFSGRISSVGNMQLSVGKLQFPASTQTV